MITAAEEGLENKIRRGETMASEQEKTVKGLQTAIQMEIDGKEYYLKASQQSGNELGRKLLRTLAGEEDLHRQKFEEIYNSIRKEKGWPRTDFLPDGGRNLRTVFAQATEQMGPKGKIASTEMEAIKTAMDMENQTYDFYQQQEKQASYNAEMEFYQALSAQEKEHYLVLLDYYEYLKDPAAWFVEKEHPSLDGG
jgi:rubrerythrin